jgi:transcriptional regulator with XRE-family HTH domain
MLLAVETHRVRLGTIVRDRRQALEMTQREAADAAGFSDMTWFKVERGDVVSERTLIGVDRALRWKRGSAKDVLAGGDPTELPDAAGHDEDLRAVVAELRERLARVEAALEDERNDRRRA